MTKLLKFEQCKSVRHLQISYFEVDLDGDGPAGGAGGGAAIEDDEDDADLRRALELSRREARG